MGKQLDDAVTIDTLIRKHEATFGNDYITALMILEVVATSSKDK